MMILEVLDSLCILVTLVFFSLGSYYDMKAREVSDRVWLAYAPIGIGLTIGHLIVDASALLLVAISAGVTVLIAFGLFYLGLFGDADAMAILCLGATMPLAPSSIQTTMGLGYPWTSSLGLPVTRYHHHLNHWRPLFGAVMKLVARN